MIKFFKYLLISLTTLIVLLSILPLFFDKEKIYEEIEKIANQKLQQKISFDKNVEINFFPVPKVIISNVQYNDKTAGFIANSKKVKVFSSWLSIFQLNLKVHSIELISPKIELNNFNQFSQKRLKVLIGGKTNGYHDKLNYFKKKIDELLITNGEIIINNKEKIYKFNSLDMKLIVKNNNKVYSNGDFILENFPLKFDFNFNTYDLKEINLDLITNFNKKSSLKTSGKILIENNIFNFRGSSSSKLIELDNFFLVSYLLKEMLKKNQVYFVNTKSKKINILIDTFIDKISTKNLSFDKTSFEIKSDEKNLKIPKFNSYFENSLLSGNANYNFGSELFNGVVNVNKLMIKENFFGTTKYDIYGGELNSKIFFKIKQNKNFFKSLSAEGSFITGPIRFKGIDLSRISSNFDTAETFQDFFNLVNVKNWKGTSLIDSINGGFNLKNGTIFLKNIVSSHKNVKLKTLGNFSFLNDQILFENRINVSTKKFKNLPEFGVNVSGTKKDYKITYDVEKVRKQILTSGINSILKNQKKLIIDPKSFNKFLEDKNPENFFNPDSIIEFFSN